MSDLTIKQDGKTFKIDIDIEDVDRYYSNYHDQYQIEATGTYTINGRKYKFVLDEENLNDGGDFEFSDDNAERFFKKVKQLALRYLSHTINEEADDLEDD